MTENNVTRKLAAILAADVVGYSRLMSVDESGTLEQLMACMNDVVRPTTVEHRGRIFKTMGDGFLVEFASAVEAVECAVRIQRAMAEISDDVTTNNHIVFRIGINLGDVVIQGDDILGDGVNVAARIEGITDPGGVFISQSVYDQITGKCDYTVVDLGRHVLKNIPQPVHVFRIQMKPLPPGKVLLDRLLKPSVNERRILTIVAVIVLAVTGYVFFPNKSLVETGSLDFCKEKTILALPDKPSIAVLPFDNISGDQKHEAFSDGLTEDIITSLAKVDDLFVIARNSSSSYKGKPVKVQRVAEELGVRYVLEGSVQWVNEQLRITAQLIDADTGSHLWAERFERGADDLFAVSDQVVAEILTALQVELTDGEMAKAFRHGTTNLEASLLYLKSMDEFQRFNKEANAKSRNLAERVTQLDPGYWGGWLMLGWSHLGDIYYGGKRPEAINQSKAFADKVMDMDATNPFAYMLHGYIAMMEGNPEEAVALGREAISLNTNIADSHAMLGLFLNSAGRPEEAIPSLKKAMRLSPYYPTFYLLQLAKSYRRTGRHEEAILAYRKLLCRSPDLLFAYSGMIASYDALGQDDEARRAAKELLISHPDYSLATYRNEVSAYTKPMDLERQLGYLRDAGVPE